MGRCENTVREPARELPVAGTYDVTVAGAGIAGVAAAVAAARNGASVCLLERTCGVGGLATLGNVIVWLPLCDGRGRQVMAGLPEELIRLSVHDLGRDVRSARFRRIPACWQPGGDPAERRKVRYRAEFNPAAYLLSLEKLVTGSGIRVLYDTRVCAVVRNADRISHLIVENKSGRSAVACGAVIDATGDADVCFLAGEDTESLDTNVLSGWFYYLDRQGLNLDALSKQYSPAATREGAEGPFFRGDDGDQVTDYLLGSHELTRQRLADIRAERPGDDVQIVCLPSIPCFRMTRRLVGAFSLGADHLHRWFDDAVGLTGDWRRAGPVYAVPWRSLHGLRNRNLLTAGRCISVDSSAWDVTRAIPTCALTGAAAGVASALAVSRAGGNVHALPVRELQYVLGEQGFLLDPALVEPAAREETE